MPTADMLREPGQTTTSAASKAPVDERRVTAWIGQGVVVEGKITSAQDLRIDGKVEGTIEVGNHGLILGASAAVKANLIARSILISGAVIGNVTATERVDLQETGSVEGDISSPRLVVVDGAVVNGKIETHGTRATSNQRR
jgi:cytoskeletal protein CcmA (bactofilin family)